MAQIEFFSTLDDEKQLFSQISRDISIKCSLITDGRFKEWINLNDLQISDSDSPFRLCIWKKDFGNIKWLTQEPRIDSTSHSKLVKSLFTKEHWKREKEQGSFKRMIDDENSPILYYVRGRIVYDYKLPNYILSPQSSINKMGDDFRKWFNRITSWIRRNGTMVYNWKMAEKKIRNDLSFANTIYALPGAKEKIDLNEDKFAISVNTLKYDK